MTLSDALVAYKTYARAESKSPKTIRWIMSSVTYFADFLGPEHQDIASITGNNLRQFIITLQEKRNFSHHPYNQPQQTKLSPQTVETCCRAIKSVFWLPPSGRGYRIHGEGEDAQGTRDDSAYLFSKLLGKGLTNR